MEKIGRCIHFTGIQNKTCKAGVSYDSFDGVLPCITVADARLCEKYQDPTPEQIAESKAAHDASMERFRTVMMGIRGWRTWTKKNRVAKQEVIECPACKGRLHLSQAAYNGHVHGQCETKGCVSWME